MRQWLIPVCVAIALMATCTMARADSYAHDRCNIDWPCAGVTTSVRGERVVKAMGGFGSARKVYTPLKVRAGR